MTPPGSEDAAVIPTLVPFAAPSCTLPPAGPLLSAGVGGVKFATAIEKVRVVLKPVPSLARTVMP